jgi:tetratricopeptide (TPR) repeat protein
MNLTHSHGREFVRQALPLLARMDTPRLLEHLHQNWPNSALRDLLACGEEDARKVAVVCLALTGSSEDLPSIAAVLHDDDPTTAGFAEHAMWSIWFREAGPAAENLLARAVEWIGRNQLDEAIGELASIVHRYPDLAEAHNQLGIAHFLKGEYAAAIDDCRRVLELNPYHFGALAGLGHCHAARGELREAYDAYRRALRLHPRLEGIRQTLMQVRKALREVKPPGAPFPTGSEQPTGT